MGNRGYTVVMNSYAQTVLDQLTRKYHWEPEFLQAVEEVLQTLSPLLSEEPKYARYRILERIVEPERIIMFRVPWVDDRGEIRVNSGFRVEFNSALGPYKGGLRFHPSVNLSILKFLGFEQTFKNSLTGMPMGGGKGGSDFDPKGKSEMEVMRFSQSFMSELFRHIGPNTDVPAGDIGVGGREIGFLYGQYKRLRLENTGVLTGKGRDWGGSLIRPEATGYGSMYFAKEMVEASGDSMEGKRISVSGFGNVAWGVCKKASELGAKVITISGPDGFILDEEGINTEEKWEYLLELRASNNDVVEPYAEMFSAKFFPGKRPWTVPVDMAVPCAIQNELDGDDAEQLIKNGVKYVVETSNMGCTADAGVKFITANVLFAPGKAANAGGVATSGLEMSQNAMRLAWTREEVDEKLHRVMINIHESCRQASASVGYEGNYVVGANIAGFKKVADAMIDQGVV